MPIYKIWNKAWANYKKEPTSKWNFGTLTSSPSTDVTHSWTRHGQDSNPQWRGCLPWQHGMGHLLYLSYSPYSLSRLFNILFIADWNKIGDYRQRQTDLNTAHINSKQVDYDYKVGDKVLLTEEGILCKAESPYSKKPWTITMIYRNGTIGIGCMTKLERFNIQRVTPFTEE